MDTPKGPLPSPPARRWRKRVVIPCAIGLGLALFLGWAFVRGTWADNVPKDPATPADGVVCHLYQPPGGPKQVRCALVLDYPAEEVWKVVTDYERFGEIFPTLKSVEATRRPDGRCRLKGVATSWAGDRSFDILIRQEA